MGNKFVSIEQLPVEIIHRIFDNLDVETIFFSVQLVSKSFQSMVKYYNRYVLDFKSISKPNFYILCRLIKPENVISLILCNKRTTSDQIDLFISFNHLEQFNRLRSLTLLEIDESQLDFILQRIYLDSLTSFTLTIRKHDNTCVKLVADVLKLLPSRSNLRKMKFNIDEGRHVELLWPVNSSIQHLTIKERISIDNLLTIFRCSPHLHTLIMDENPRGYITNPSGECFRQLLSLSILYFSPGSIRPDSLLSLTPSLVYLKLISEEEMPIRGTYWERIITTNLPQLNKFEFCIGSFTVRGFTEEDILSIMSSFQTSFWIKHKKWFVICERKVACIMHVYSLPISVPVSDYLIRSQKMIASTYSIETNSNISLTNNITSFSLIVPMSRADDDIQEKGSLFKIAENHPIYPAVTELKIGINGKQSWFSLKTLSAYIDISRIVRMTIYGSISNNCSDSIWEDIGNIIKNAHNVSDLSIGNSTQHTTPTIEPVGNIHLYLPPRVKHLQIPINDLQQINTTFERCKHLSTIIFVNNQHRFPRKIVNWFSINTINSTCREHGSYVYIWLGKRKLEQRNTYRILELYHQIKSS